MKEGNTKNFQASQFSKAELISNTKKEDLSVIKSESIIFRIRDWANFLTIIFPSLSPFTYRMADKTYKKYIADSQLN